MAGAGVGVLERRGSLLLSLILPACPPWPLAGRACSLSPSGAYTCSLCLKYCPPPHICSAPSFPPQVIFKSWSCYLLSEAFPDHRIKTATPSSIHLTLVYAFFLP